MPPRRQVNPRRPWREDIALRIARHLEASGAAVAQRPEA